MKKWLKGWTLAGSLILLLASSLAMATGSGGTADEAKAMLERAVAALQEDQQAALAMFTAGEGGFKDRDLYVFCGGPDGNFTAHGANPSLVGKSLKDLKDKTGTPLGEALYATASEGEFKEVTYLWPRPGETELVSKSTFVTKVSDQICGVGYYPE